MSLDHPEIADRSDTIMGRLSMQVYSPTLAGFKTLKWQQFWFKVVEDRTKKVVWRNCQRKIYLHSCESPAGIQDVPDKMVVIDSDTCTYRLEFQDKPGRFFVSVPVRGNCGKLDAIADGRITIVFQSEPEANNFVQFCCSNRSTRNLTTTR
eukprot:CAMPEP_0113729802 /NCGR_PEP_ID=MMETSP0038_2-20120614/42779_1 /TAXON_ID=2898 /ORGANISM="Cryptomonas paramecium" /LENGTH=150 /DNA_ID=CAMNT_0000661739 /DNA_START=1 /DNA_END=453 /DNA_ORIENTATION=- /assembly_acc=CAM_ASM_000170